MARAAPSPADIAVAIGKVASWRLDRPAGRAAELVVPAL